MSRVDFLSRRGGWSGSGQFCSTRPMPSRTSSCTRSCHASLGVQAGWWSRSCSTTAGGGWNLQWQNIALAWLYSRTFFSQVNIRNIRETLKTNGNIHRLTTTSREKLKNFWSRIESLNQITPWQCAVFMSLWGFKLVPNITLCSPEGKPTQWETELLTWAH